MDFTGVAIEGGAEAGERGARGEGAEAAPGIVLPHQAEGGVGHFAVDIGGSLAKLVYFSGRPGGAGGARCTSSSSRRRAWGKPSTSSSGRACTGPAGGREPRGRGRVRGRGGRAARRRCARQGGAH